MLSLDKAIFKKNDLKAVVNATDLRKALKVLKKVACTDKQAFNQNFDNNAGFNHLSNGNKILFEVKEDVLDKLEATVANYVCVLRVTIPAEIEEAGSMVISRQSLEKQLKGKKEVQLHMLEKSDGFIDYPDCAYRESDKWTIKNKELSLSEHALKAIKKACSLVPDKDTGMDRQNKFVEPCIIQSKAGYGFIISSDGFRLYKEDKLQIWGVSLAFNKYLFNLVEFEKPRVTRKEIGFEGDKTDRVRSSFLVFREQQKNIHVEYIIPYEKPRQLENFDIPIDLMAKNDKDIAILKMPVEKLIKTLEAKKQYKEKYEDREIGDREIERIAVAFKDSCFHLQFLKLNNEIIEDVKFEKTEDLKVSTTLEGLRMGFHKKLFLHSLKQVSRFPECTVHFKFMNRTVRMEQGDRMAIVMGLSRV